MALHHFSLNAASVCRPDLMDRAVLRPGRFGKLLYVPLPTADERGLILKALARKKPIDANVDLCSCTDEGLRKFKWG